MAAFATAGNAAPSLSCQHVLHVFPSFGVGGVPLRMVRVINHFGKRFRHTVIALDNNFEAAGGFACDLDVALSPVQALNWGTLHALLDSALALRRLRPDLLITYNWGAIEWAMANRLWPGSRHIHAEAGFSQREADSQIPGSSPLARARGFSPPRMAFARGACEICAERRRCRALFLPCPHARRCSQTRRTRNRDGRAIAPRKECRAPPTGIRNSRYFDHYTA